MNKLKVLIVDDCIIYRKILKVAVEETGIAEVSHTSSNGAIALERMAHKEMDVVILDVFMPEMGGMEALEQIKKLYPKTEVIIMTSESNESIELTVKALEMGAVDFILKPTEDDIRKNMDKLKSYLIGIFAQIKVNKKETINIERFPNFIDGKNESNKIKDMEKRLIQNSMKVNNNIKKHIPKGADVIVIASSTGGPIALDQICTALPKDINIPIFIVQHMPSGFTKSMAQALNKKSKINISEAQEGEEVKGGKVYVAPGGYHLVIRNEKGTRRVYTKKTELVNGVRPSADVFFQSAAEDYKGKRILAIILTGMGKDGVQGIKKMKEKCFCHCITQSKETCVVYGMPRSVYEAGLSDEVLDLKDIPHRILQIVLDKS